MFGELSVLLDQPHTADVRALEASQFHVADAASMLRIDPVALLYVATLLAQRLDSANRGLLELKRRFRPATRAAKLEERSRRSKNCWAPLVRILCMPAIRMTRSLMYRRAKPRTAETVHSSSWASGLRYQSSFEQQPSVDLARYGVNDTGVLGSREQQIACPLPRPRH